MGALEDYTKLLLAQKRGQQTHTKSYSQDKSIEQMDKEALQALSSGLRQWPGDALGFVGDIADGAYYAGKRVLSGQGQKSIPSLGAGAAIRRKVGNLKPRAQPEVTSSEDDPRTEAMRFANPLAFVNPGSALKAANTPLGRGVLGMLAKGFANGKPESKYVPAIQDFVKSGKWHEVRDVHNADMEFLYPDKARYLDVEPGYYTNDEVQAFYRALPEDPGFAKGGLVSKELLTLHGY